MTEPIQVTEFSNEPEWMQISRVYESLRAATEALYKDIAHYNRTLMVLDGAGTDVFNGKERIFLMKEELARLEAVKP